VIGMARDAALAKLQEAGFAAVALIRSQCSGPTEGCHAKRGLTWRQSPASGETLLPGSNVTIWVNPSD
jgi:hypothetical protein